MKNGEIIQLSFRVLDVRDGWIFAQLSTPEQTLELTHSLLCGAALLKELACAADMLAAGTSGEEWLCWNEEAQAYLWQMTSEQELLQLNIYRTDKGFGLPLRGFGLAEKVRRKSPVFSAKTDRWAFARRIREAVRPWL